MKLHYYSETDSLYIELTEHDSVDSKEASPGVVLDYDSNGVLVGIDIDHASTITDVSNIQEIKNATDPSAPKQNDKARLPDGVSRSPVTLVTQFIRRLMPG
jgi:uncharacterized protein YuzE